MKDFFKKVATNITAIFIGIFIGAILMGVSEALVLRMTRIENTETAKIEGTNDKIDVWKYDCSFVVYDPDTNVVYYNTTPKVPYYADNGKPYIYDPVKKELKKID